MRYSMFLGRKKQYSENENDYSTKCSLQIQCDPWQIANDIFHRSSTKISQFLWKHKRPRIAKAVLRKKKGAGETTFLTSDYPTKLQYEVWRQYCTHSYSMKTVWYWHKNGNVDQWNKTESPEINSCTHSNLLFDKGGKNLQWGKDSLFNKWSGKTGQLCVQQWN